jgi:RNase H-fold protein (predicted Holliday junction resolvase)
MNSNSKTTYFLGIDWGKSRVGLSLADSETRIAFVYGTIKNDDDFIKKMVEIIKKERVKTVVIGIPSYVNRKDVEYDGEKLGK